jgi:hypothetical protein
MFILALTLVLKLRGPKGEALLQTESNETASVVISMAADLPAGVFAVFGQQILNHCLNEGVIK